MKKFDFEAQSANFITGKKDPQEDNG